MKTLSPFKNENKKLERTILKSDAVQKVKPFLKWAGGKRWLLYRHSSLFPKTFNTYIEPFLGSGAVYFHLNPKRAILSDINLELIETYNAIRNDWISVVKELKKHHLKHSKTYYYHVRSLDPYKQSERAARFIYLNRTCWNGLYRVNLQGKFNVPMGTKTKVYSDDDDFQSTSKTLKNAVIKCSDFERVIDQAQSGDFVFVDPPYTGAHNQNNFVKYNEFLFSWKDQIRLRDCLKRATKRGAFILLTNADHVNVKELYKDFDYESMVRSSAIAAESKNRRPYEELIVKTF
jgi:DNA adenine methylase